MPRLSWAMGHLLDLFYYYSIILDLKLLCLGQGKTRLPDTVELGSTTVLHAVLGTIMIFSKNLQIHKKNKMKKECCFTYASLTIFIIIYIFACL